MIDPTHRNSGRRRKLATCTAGLVLVGFVGFLLHSNYRSQLRLRTSAVDQLVSKAQANALGIEYFLYERKNDLETIRESRSLLVYFENKALDMSMDYGLRSSLLAVAQDFRRIAADRTIDNERIFERIAFIDIAGEMLVDTNTEQTPRPATGVPPPPPDAPDAPDAGPQVMVATSGDQLQLQVVAPFHFKGEYVGRIVAWIAPGIVQGHLLRETGTATRFSRLVAPGRGTGPAPHVHAPTQHFTELPDFARLDTRTPQSFVARDRDGRDVEIIAVGVPLQSCALTLVHAAPAIEVLGESSPRQLLAVMGLLALLVLGGAALALRSSTRNLLLRTRLDEASQHTEEIEAANRQLRSEIAARQRAEQELQHAHDRLEERVQQRTAELSGANQVLERQGQQERIVNALLRISLDEQPVDQQLHNALDEVLSVPWLPLSRAGGIFLRGDAEDRLELRAQRNIEPALSSCCASAAPGYCPCGRPAPDAAPGAGAQPEWRHTGVVGPDHYCVPINSGDRNLGLLLLYLADDHVEDAPHLSFLRSVTQILVTLLERHEARSRLATAQKELVNASHQAGMAEVASSVLHNVGNVLNSVNVSATLVSERVRNSRVSAVRQLSSLVNEHGSDLGAFLTQDDRGARIPGYLSSLADALANEQADILKEIGLLEKNIDHIKRVVVTQQDYAKLAGMRQPFGAAEILHDALRLCQSTLVSHGIRVEEKIDEVPEIVGDPQKTLQILINVIANAAHALQSSTQPDRRIITRLTATDAGFLRIEIEDNGIGIPADAMSKIFHYGYTTKRSGHGFGLHHAVLAAREMGGTLEAHSGGVGRGARFTLSLPLDHAHADA